MNLLYSGNSAAFVNVAYDDVSSIKLTCCEKRDIRISKETNEIT